MELKFFVLILRNKRKRTTTNNKEVAMAERKKVWVSPDGHGGWNAKTQGAQRAVGNYEDKADALDKAKEVAKNASLGQVIVQGRNGKIQTEYTYGKDPRNIPG